MTLKDIYTKDNTVLTPNGHEYLDLNFALKAYNLDMDTFNSRLEKAKTLYELFCGLDYDCGLRHDLDGTIHDFQGNKYVDLKEMCDFYKADIKLFETLYSLGVDLKTCLLQPSYVKSEEYIEKLKKDKEEKELKEKEEQERLRRENELQEAKLQEVRKRVHQARLVLEKYYALHIKGTKSFTKERATQIVQLCDMSKQNRRLTHNETSLYNRAKISLETRTALSSDVPDVNRELVRSILGDIKYRYFDGTKITIKEDMKLREVVNQAIKTKLGLSGQNEVASDVTNSMIVASSSKEEKVNSLVKPLDMTMFRKKAEENEKMMKKENVIEITPLEEAIKNKEMFKVSENKDIKVSDENVIIEPTKLSDDIDFKAIQLETIRILRAYLGDK